MQTLTRPTPRVEIVGAPEPPGSRLDRVVGYLGGAVAAFALYGLALWPYGEPSAAVRVGRLVAILGVSLALAVLWRRANRIGRGIVELAVGSVGLIAGGVATVPRIAELPTAHQILGVLATLAGVGLLAIGSARLVGAIRSRRLRLLAIPVGVLLSIYVLAPVGFGVLVTNHARPTLGPRTPADLGLAYEDLTVHGEDGLVLRAWYVPSGNGSAVLMLPGSGSTRDDVLDHAALVAGDGYGVLMLDVPGHGGSSGEPMEWGWGADAYLPGAIDVLEARDDVTGAVAVFGLSMGGEQALTLAAADERVAAVVSEGASTRTAADALRLGHTPIETALGYPITWLAAATADLLADASPPIPLEDAVRASTSTPLLLISAGAGQERAANRIYAEAAGDRAELWELPGASHVGAIRADPDAYEQRVLAFLDASLLGA